MSDAIHKDLNFDDANFCTYFIITLRKKFTNLKKYLFEYLLGQGSTMVWRQMLPMV